MIAGYILFLHSGLCVKAAGITKSSVRTYPLWNTTEDDGLNIRLVGWCMQGTRRSVLSVGIPI